MDIESKKKLSMQEIAQTLLSNRDILEQKINDSIKEFEEKHNVMLTMYRKGEKLHRGGNRYSLFCVYDTGKASV